MRTPTISARSPEMAIRWVARLLSALFVTIVILIFIGERFNPFKLSAQEVVQMIFFWSCCIGMLVAWRWELIGGCIATGAMVLFYITEYAVTGRFPHGLAFRLMLLPGILFILSSNIRSLRRKRVHTVAARR